MGSGAWRAGRAAASMALHSPQDFTHGPTMPSIIASTHVAAPLERTFQVFTEIDQAAERIPGITQLEMLSEGPFGEGTRWRETRVIMKKEATEEMWVTGFQPPHRYTVEAESHGTHYETLFQFEPEGDGTKVTWNFKGTPQTFGAKLTAPLFGFFFKGMMKRCMHEDLEALRDVCEGKAPAGAPADGAAAESVTPTA